MEVGRRIGKYVLDERIAVGGMAEVWAAHAEGREGFVKPVALKFILESFSGDPELERLFVNEARIAARLQHANLVTVFDFDKVADDGERGIPGRYYIAMERVEGQDLRRIAEATRRAGYVFPVGVALYVAGEMLKALRYVHNFHDRKDARGPLGLVHRDVSPHNVLVGYTGEVKLSDFGIAKAREHSARNTKPGSLRGKISYASPEQLSGGVVDHRTDQFAAGVTIWELLSGRRLFDGASDLEIIGKVARCEIPALGAREGRPDVAAAVEAVLRRMLAAEPRARFATTRDALSAVLALPGYSPDGAPLGELVRALFTPAGAGLSRTLPLQMMGAVGAGVATRTMDDAPVPRIGDETPERVAPPASGERSPVGDSRATTADVRSGPGVARFVGSLVFGAAVAAAVLARHQLGFGPGPSRAVAASPRPAPVAVALPPPAPTAVEPVRAPPPVVVRPGPETRLPSSESLREPLRAVRGEHAVIAEPRRGERAHGASRTVATPDPVPPARTPEPSARPVEPAPPKSSLNGAPILE